jgi:hypothetical protein
MVEDMVKVQASLLFGSSDPGNVAINEERDKTRRKKRMKAKAFAFTLDPSVVEDAETVWHR